MTNEEQFVNELIGYIFAYPDDDYMTMECLCRKLHKYGLIDKKDGEWTTDFIDRKDESSSEKPNNCKPKICDFCRYYNSNIPCGSTPSACKEADKFAEEFVEGLKKLKPTISKMEQVDWKDEMWTEAIEDEPQTEQVGVPFGEMDEATFKSHCLNCQRDTADIKCLDCDGNKYFLSYGSEADCPWK